MPPIILVAAGLVGAAASFGLWLVLSPQGRVRQEVVANVTSGIRFATSAGAADPTEVPAIVARLAVPGTRARIERLIAKAGHPAAWPMRKVLIAKLGMPAVAAALGALYVLGGPSTMRVLMATVFVVVAHFVPDLLLISAGQERQAQIALELADTLDQMTIGVEAGLGFESAMLRTARNGKGALSEELMRTLQDMQLGMSRREAYLALAARTSVPDLRRFLRAVMQADAFGVAIADVLRTQAAEMRMKRRQRAEEKAMKIPVKVIFPLMFCILPALFIVLMGPAVIDVMKAFSN